MDVYIEFLGTMKNISIVIILIKNLYKIPFHNDVLWIVFQKNCKGASGFYCIIVQSALPDEQDSYNVGNSFLRNLN